MSSMNLISPRITGRSVCLACACWIADILVFMLRPARSDTSCGVKTATSLHDMSPALVNFLAVSPDMPYSKHTCSQPFHSFLQWVDQRHLRHPPQRMLSVFSLPSFTSCIFSMI